MSKFKHVLKIFLIILGVGILIFGIPIVINECYKANCGYSTAWDASATLGYYGTILGAIITVVSLVATISFTKKQIRRESFLKRENEKWSNLELLFTKIIDGINPITMLKSIIDNGLTDPSAAINILQKFQMNCRTSYDQLNAHLNMIDYPKVKQLIDEISGISEDFVRISQGEIDQYSDLRLLQHKDSALQLLEFEKQHPGMTSFDNIAFNKEIVEKTKIITFENINSKIAKLNTEFVDAYETKYKSLLRLKGSTFECLYRDISDQADSMLNIREPNSYNRSNKK